MSTLEKQNNLGHIPRNYDLEAPAVLTYPKEIRSGDTIEIYWTPVEDVLGILKGYYIELTTEPDYYSHTDDYTVYTKVYEGPDTKTTLYIEKEWEWILCRVAAIDVDGKRSHLRYMSWGQIEIIQEPKNTAPNIPSYITIPSAIKGGESISISWAEAVDGEDNLDGYVLEVSTNSGSSWLEIYNGSSNEFSYSVVYGTEKLTFRVKAYDTEGEYSDYKTSSTVVVSNNSPPSTPLWIYTPSIINGGEAISVSWGSSTDSDGNLSGYILEVSNNRGIAWSQVFKGFATNSSYNVVSGTETLIFRVKAYDSMGAESDYCSSSVLSVVNNTPPSTPLEITTPSTINGGETISVSWGSSTDSEGNLAGYTLEVSVNNGSSWSEVFKGFATYSSYNVVFGTKNLIFRVKAYDSMGAESGYCTSSTLSVINNTPPKISGTDSNLGTHTFAFTQNYTVTDDEGGVVTVVEKVDGSTLKSYNVSLGTINTLAFSEKEWMKLSNGSHTITIIATDSAGDFATRSYTFTKSETEIYLTYTTPISATEMPTVGVYYITKNIPVGASFAIKVCNNGFDTAPTWEDVTTAVNAGGRFYFNNQSKTASKWGVNAVIEVKRNNALGDCYISRVQGHFK